MARNCIIGLLSIVITLGFGSLGYASDLSDCDRNGSPGKIAAAAKKNPGLIAEALRPAPISPRQEQRPCP